MRSRLTLCLLFGATLLGLPVLASAADVAVGTVQLKTHHPTANGLLNEALSNTSFWSDAWSKSYDDKLYDEVRLKPLAEGYFPMIAGEGDEDIPHEVVADIVFKQQTKLPKYMSGAKAVVSLGEGYDSVVGAPYNDVFWVLDVTLFYATYPQRMYRRHDPESGRTVLWFEKLDSSFVDAATWTRYQKLMTETVDGMERRWPPFNSIVPVGEVYGMFVVTPGTRFSSRVTFITKLTFGEDAGFIAQWGSQLPSVLKSGLKAGFNASVAIAKDEKARRAKVAPAPPPAPAPEPTPAPAEVAPTP